MELKDLELVIALSKTLHFNRASQECHVSASTLTRAIQRMESELGAPLFERDNRAVRLTRAGLIFREFAVDTLQRWGQLKQEIHEQQETLQGNLSVFCSVTASYSFLHDLLNRFRQRHPAVEIHLHTGDSALAIQRILDEEDDIGVAARPDQLPDRLCFKEIGRSSLVFIVPDSPCPVLDKLRSVPIGAEIPWNELPFILSETGLARMRVERWFRARGLNPEIYAQVGGNEAIVSMVSLGFGVAVVPELVVENSPIRSKIRILSVQPELEPFSIGICCLKRRLSNPLVKAFWDLSPESDDGR